MGVCLGIDAGRTGCRAALSGGRGVAAGPGLPAVAEGGGGTEPVVAALEPLVRQLPLPVEPLEAVCVGATGVLDPAGPAAALVAEAVRAVVPARRVLVTSDVVTGYCGALGFEPGVVVAAGTGSITLGVGRHQAARVDGWGYLLDDAGSGFEVGRRGLAAALRARDGRGGSELLARLAEEAFGPPSQLVRAVYGAANPVRAVAAFARQVAEAARQGDREARAIWAGAAAELAGAALAAAAAVLAPGEPGGLSWTGSLFEARDLLLEPFLARVTRARPSLAPRPPRGSALDGALLLATGPLPPHVERLLYRWPAGA